MIIDLAMRRIAPYGASVLLIGAAALARAGLGPFLGDHYPLGTFYAAVAIIGWFWGVGPAVLAAILGYLVGDYLFTVAARLAETLGLGTDGLWRHLRRDHCLGLPRL